jgi:hypothetical protein
MRAAKGDATVKYMFLICYDPTRPPDPGPSRRPEHARVEAEMRAEGVYAGGAAMVPPEFVPPVRLRGGKVIDGPFPETKELLGGYFVVECADADDALRQAARIPLGSNDWIEIRPLVMWHPL